MFPHDGQSRARGLALKQTAAIARATLVEAIQQPVAFLILLAAVMTTLLVPVFQFHRFGEDGRLARDSGLACMLVFGLVLAAGTAGRTVSGEITCGTAAAALGKPVRRVTFLLAKALGVLAVTMLFWLGVLCATLLAERGSAHFISHIEYTGYVMDVITLVLGVAGVAVALLVAAARHYYGRRRFGVSAFVGVVLSQVLVVLATGFYNRLGQLYPLLGEAACLDSGAGHAHAAGWVFYHPELNLRVIPVALLVLFALAIFAALATALATRLPTGPTLAICAGVLLLGLAGDSLLIGAPFWSVRGLVAGLLPDLQNFWLCDAVARGGRIAWRYVGAAALYALTCCVLFLGAGCLAFRERDLG